MIEGTRFYSFGFPHQKKFRKRGKKIDFPLTTVRDVQCYVNILTKRIKNLYLVLQWHGKHFSVHNMNFTCHNMKSSYEYNFQLQINQRRRKKNINENDTSWPLVTFFRLHFLLASSKNWIDVIDIYFLLKQSRQKERNESIVHAQWDVSEGVTGKISKCIEFQA